MTVLGIAVAAGAAVFGAVALALDALFPAEPPHQVVVNNYGGVAPEEPPF